VDASMITNRRETHTPAPPAAPGSFNWQTEWIPLLPVVLTLGRKHTVESVHQQSDDLRQRLGLFLCTDTDDAEIVRVIHRRVAERVFDPLIVFLILLGMRGPWSHVDVPPVNLAFRLRLLEDAQYIASVRARRQPRELLFGRQCTSVQNTIRRMQISPADKSELLSLLKRKRAELIPAWPKQYRFLGLSCNPNAPLARQEFMTPLIVHLVDYLDKVRDVSLEETFRITASIVHFASGRRYPDSPAAVKGRYLRWLKPTRRS